MRVTSKGQVTIPRDMRELAGIEPNSEVVFALEGGNIGLQLGGNATDFVLLIMNPRGAESLFKSKVKLGADAAAAAGPKRLLPLPRAPSTTSDNGSYVAF